MKSKTTIEVNGKRYDANTGEVIGVATSQPARAGQNIDGFFRARSTTVGAAPTHQGVTVVAAPAPAPKPHAQPARAINHARAHAPQAPAMVRVHESASERRPQSVAVRHTAAAINHTRAHTTQSSKTLRRDGVQRPAPSFYKQAGTVGSLQHSVPSLIVPKTTVANIQPTRLARALTTLRSPHISRHSESPHTVEPTFAAVAVQPAPTPGDGQPSPTPPSLPTNKPPTPTDIFEHALANATNFVDVRVHNNHFRKQARRHITSMAAGTLALLVIAGFAAYQNTPGLQFRVASIQAGVSTHMPNLKAAGFAYNGAHAGNGKLTVGFSNSSTHYQLTQQATNLSSGDMIRTVGATDASGAPIYKTVHAGDTTVYRFDNTSATWVSGGTWYTVNGNGSLSDSQVKSLVQNI